MRRSIKFGCGVAWVTAGAALGLLTAGLPTSAFAWGPVLLFAVCVVGLPIACLCLAIAVLDWLRIVIRGP